VSQAFWAERDTTPTAIEAALRQLLRERHAAYPELAPARVLNLVVVVDREWRGEVANRLQRMGRYQASRTVLCAVEPGRTTLDARAVTVYDDRSGRGSAVMREEVEIDLGPEHLEHLDTIVDPVIVSELPTVLWCPHGHEQAVDALIELTDVMLLDSDDEPDPVSGLGRASELLRSAYVVDLAWLRTTPWRERIAATFDLPERRAVLGSIDGIAVRHRASSRASALLLAGWLASRLHWKGSPLAAPNGAGWSGVAHRGKAAVAVELVPIPQDAPGLGGVSVSAQDGFSISLDRAPGGLVAKVRSGDSAEASWRLLGASRGEGGILGEGVRQALLRDPTYGPALTAARAFGAGVG
jgi:glucose-6-phosphate dehydrogenase assembly protein OpcA